MKRFPREKAYSSRQANHLPAMIALLRDTEKEARSELGNFRRVAHRLITDTVREHIKQDKEARSAEVDQGFPSYQVGEYRKGGYQHHQLLLPNRYRDNYTKRFKEGSHVRMMVGDDPTVREYEITGINYSPSKPGYFIAYLKSLD